MSLRSRHGKSKQYGAGPVVEVAPLDEQPVGVPAPTGPDPDRSRSGQFQPGAGTREMARRAGRASAESRQLKALMGLRDLPEGHVVGPYKAMASEWRDAYLAELAALVGGGQVGAGPSSVAASAALQLGASRALFDLVACVPKIADAARLLALAARLADSSRQNVLASRELAALEAQARKTANDEPNGGWLAPPIETEAPEER